MINGWFPHFWHKTHHLVGPNRAWYTEGDTCTMSAWCSLFPNFSGAEECCLQSFCGNNLLKNNKSWEKTTPWNNPSIDHFSKPITKPRCMSWVLTFKHVGNQLPKHVSTSFGTSLDKLQDESHLPYGGFHRSWRYPHEWLVFSRD